MNVSVDDIKNIKPGRLELFTCDDMKKLRSGRSLIAFVKDTGMPEGVVDYESERFNIEGLKGDQVVLAIRAMREGDTKILNL
jgi:hypothetical protein